MICRLCKKLVSAKGGNTSNLLSHLKVHHPQRHLEVKKANSKSGKDKDHAKTGKASRQPSLPNTLRSGHKYERKSRKWQQLTDAVTYCLAKDMMPIYSVEKEGFVCLLHFLDSQYELPSRKYFSNVAIPKLYAQTRDVVSAEIKSAEFLAATTDMWSSYTTEPYFSYTSWEIDVSKQVCLTTDNGSNIVCATESCLGWTHLSCFGHNLHLAVQNSTKNDRKVDRALGVCKKLVSTFSHSWKKKREMRKIQEELGLPQHCLVTDCATRWGSTQKMIARVLEQEKAIRKVLSDDWKTAHLIPTWQDIDVLESIQAALGPLADFTDMLSGENFVTMSTILPVLHILKNEVLKESENDTQLTKDIKGRILTSMEDKYSDPDVSGLLNVACFLDPRFITEYISTSVEIAIVKDRLAREGLKW